VHLVRALAPSGALLNPVVRRHFQTPHGSAPAEAAAASASANPNEVTVIPDVTAMPPVLKNELVTDRLASIQIRSRLEALKKDAHDLDTQARQLNDAIEQLKRTRRK